MTDTELINYYVNTLNIEYKTLPKAQGTIATLVTEVIATQIFSKVRDAFDIDTAVGLQLDVIAAYVGAPRTIFLFNPNVLYMAFLPYSGPTPANVGLARYSDTAPSVDFWQTYSISPTAFRLSDGQLRQLILYLIALHASDHTLLSIDTLLNNFFGQNCTMTDNGNMTLTYTHLLSDPQILFSIVQNIGKLPRPCGVAISVVEV